MVVTSFILSLLVFVGIGALAVRKHKTTTKDYLLSSNDVKPWLAGLSAVATNNSGYMFVGQIGFTYMHGLASIWLMIGWIVGDFISSMYVHRRLRVATEKEGVLSYGGLLSNWGGTDYKYVRLIAGLVTLVFLGVYAAAQLSAGSKALYVLFGWDYAVGATLGAIIVVVYCFAGGLRASIWTDAAQSFVMFGAMLMMCVISIYTVGGFTDFWTQLADVSPEYMNIFPPDRIVGPPWGIIMFLTGWLFAGLGVIGQPHIMVRFMAMDDPNNMKKTRAYYYGFYTTFFTLTILTALAARLLLPDVANFDPELALPTLAQELLPSVLVGIVLAGLFAATISTADSQVISCTAAITNDFSKKRLNSYAAAKAVTLTVGAIALGIVLFGDDSVFNLVIIAWSTLASVFGPLLFTHALNLKMTQPWAVATMLVGFVTVVIWRELGLSDVMFEVAPGMIAGTLTAFIGYAVGAVRKKRGPKPEAL